MSESPSAPRSRILQLLDREPGLHLRELPRRLELSLNTVRYHLDVLEGEDAITPHRSGRFERWFLARSFTRQDRAVISALRVRGERAILERLLRHGPSRFVDLEGDAASPGSLVRYLNRLIADGLVVRDANRQYALRDDLALRARLNVYRVRFPDLLADAAAEIFE